MKNIGILLVAIAVLSLSLVSFVGGCSEEDTNKLQVVTSTSLIASIAERVGGDLVKVVNIIPPAQCPGHFDVKPGDIQKLADANLFLLHGWQGEKFSQDLIASANNPNFTVVKINVQGNWMTPPVQTQATDQIVNALCEVDAENSSIYQQSAAKYKNIVEAKGNEVRARIASANLSALNALCNEQQRGFVAWVGFNVVATYGTPDSLTPQVIKDLVDQGKAGDVTLIIDNLQSGKDAGIPIAQELGCHRIVLSNFPGGFSNTETWEKAIDRNIDLILEAVTQ
ncbi:MAG: zinc ABC transporter substrate-binding protein [Chloroflexi bacterium]|nr:zinc ABC transporter substrate-binding protein [Chloroflexota bacterium]